ncbi:MAG: GNAT family N-acetyltransferase [Pseudonocardiales bacterium]|nr:MAG: GNAT family N-acetyltransferase [Pseudonocardiales bacterium]
MDVVSLGFRTDLMLRRLAGSSITDRGDHLVVRTLQNPHFYWGNFILVSAAAEDPSNAAQWRAAFAAAFPDAQHVAIGLDGTSTDAACLARYRAAGLTPDVSTVLAAGALQEPARPLPGADLRRLGTDADWREALELSHELDDRSPSEQLFTERLFTERRLAESRELVESGRAAWFAAFVDGRMRCSLGLCTDGGEVARYQSVVTHPQFRGRGLASWLVFEAGRYGLDVLGARTLVIVADPDYVAIRIYRALGFAAVEHQTQFQHPA